MNVAERRQTSDERPIRWNDATSPQGLNSVEARLPANSPSSENFSVPWSGFGWAQRAVRRIKRRPSWRMGAAGVASSVVILLVVWLYHDGSLVAAAKNGNEFGVRAWLLVGADVDTRDERGMTPLMWACWRKESFVSRRLIGAGADVNQKGEDGETALMKAAYQGQYNIVDQLISASANVNDRDNSGETALLLATSKGHAGVVERLLALRADPRVAARNGLTPLMVAAVKGNVTLVNLLLPLSQVDALDEKGETALIKAAAMGHLTEVQTLLSAKADWKLANIEGATALTRAIEGGHVAVIDLLAQKGDTDNDLLLFWRGWRSLKVGQPAVAATFFQQIAGHLPAKIRTGKFVLDGWHYDVVELPCLNRLLLSECQLRLGKTVEARDTLQATLDFLHPGTTFLTLLRRRLERSETQIVERYDIRTADISWHMANPAGPWNLIRIYENEERGPGRSIRNTGQDVRDLRDLLK